MFRLCNFGGRITRHGTRVCRLTPGHCPKVTPETCNACRSCVFSGVQSVIDIPPHPGEPCRHRGEFTRIDRCGTCGDVGKPVEIFACDLHGECSLRSYKAGATAAVCLGCPDHRLHPQIINLEPPQPGQFRRHMIFHLWPKLGVDWRDFCAPVFRFRDVFDGRVIVTATTGDDCERPEIVREWLEQFDPIELSFVPNDPARGINVSFRDQIREVIGETGIVFKAHTKGISHKGDPFRQWRENMAAGCLENMRAVEDRFAAGCRSFGVFRSTAKDGAEIMGQNSGPCATPWPGWHYPGAFYWFDPACIPESFFDLPEHYYENEAFPCHLGPVSTSAAAVADNLVFASASVAPFFAILNRPLKPAELKRSAEAGILLLEENGQTTNRLPVLPGN